MPKQDQSDPKGLMGRRNFLKKITASGATLSILGAFPNASKKVLAAESSSARQLRFGGNIQLGKRVPVIARCKMLQVEKLDFMVRKGYVRIDVGYQFVDGKSEGNASFRMQLLSADKKVIAEKVVVEERIRNLSIDVTGFGTIQRDKPNRRGKAEFRFRSISPADVSEFDIEITSED